MKYLDRCFDAITAKTATHSVAPVLIANAVLNSADAVAGKRLESAETALKLCLMTFCHLFLPLLLPLFR